MSSYIRMPPVGDPPGTGTVTRIYRRARHAVDIGEPLVDVRVGNHVLTVCSSRDGIVYRLGVSAGAVVSPGDFIAEVGGTEPQFTHEIFVAYRKADAAGYAGRVADRLIRDFGGWQVFRDVSSLECGLDFVDEVRSALAKAMVMAVIIGPHWLTVGDDGRRRIDHQGDLHREEIRTALNRGLPVIPVLVDRATMPTQDELPEDIRPLYRKQAIEVHDARWEDDVGHLSEAIAKLLDRPRA